LNPGLSFIFSSLFYLLSARFPPQNDFTGKSITSIKSANRQSKPKTSLVAKPLVCSTEVPFASLCISMLVTSSHIEGDGFELLAVKKFA